MKCFSWYTIPVKLTDLSTVYQYAVDRFIPLEVDRNGFGSYIHVKARTFVTRHDGGWQRYKPNMKGGHRHNHLSNHELRLMHTKNERKCVRKFLKKDSL